MIFWQILSSVLIVLSGILFIMLVRYKRRIYPEEKKFQSLVEFSTVPIQIINADGATQYVNPSFLKWTGIEPLSVYGMKLFDMMNVAHEKNSAEDLWMMVKPVLTSGKAWVGDLEFTRSDGRAIFSGVIISPVLNSQGGLKECIILYNDQTELKKYARKIIEAQKWYEGIVESSLDGIIVVQDKKMVYVNPSGVRLFGYASVEEMQKLIFTDIIASPNSSSLDIEKEEYVIGEEILRNYEMRGLTKQSKIIDLEANAHIIEWNNRTALQTSFRDITERKMLEREQSLWLWEQETLSEIDRKLVGVVDLEKILSSILQQTLNLTRAHFSGVLLYDERHEHVQWKSVHGNSLQHSLEPFTPNEVINRMLKSEELLIIHDSESNKLYPLSELSIIGEEKLVSTIWLPLIVEGEHKGLLVVGYRHYHDFAGREMRLLISLAEKHSIAMVNAELYNNLLQREKELEILSGARVQAQEEERRRIAREIHDGLGQMLTAIKFNMEILEDKITAGKEEQDRIQDIKKLLDEVMKEAREISYNLMPSVLMDFGLVPALQLLSEQFFNRTNIKVQYHSHNIDERFNPQLEISLYRIVQESLNNIAKHAEATEVNLQVIRNAEGIRLVIEDNGKGMIKPLDSVHATDKSGMGLVSMRERANSLGGVLTIDSMPKSGTLIIVEIPIKKEN